MIRFAPLLVLLCACPSKPSGPTQLEKATGLSNAPAAPMAVPRDPEPTCPDGAQLMGAAKPRGSGQWCQKINDDGTILVTRTDGSKWIVGGRILPDGTRAGVFEIYAADGRRVRTDTWMDGERIASDGDQPIEVPPGY